METTERHEEHTHEEETKQAGLGVGVDLNVRLSGLTTTLDRLTEGLKETGEKASHMVSEAVHKLRDAGVGDLKQQAQQDPQGEAADVYDRLVAKLQDAANRGEEEARKLLHSLGENVESAGHKMQETASGEENVTH